MTTHQQGDKVSGVGDGVTAQQAAAVLKKVLDDRTDLDEYGADKRLLFALQLHQGIDDIHAVAVDALTDGGQDHGCDLIYIDPDSEKLIIAQGFETPKSALAEPKVWKAAALNQSVAWLLSGKPEDLPSRLKPAGEAIHQALQDGHIKEMQFWFVHNQLESVNARAELDATAHLAARVLQDAYPGSSPERIIGLDVGVHTLYRWYQGSRSPILVTDEITVTVDDCFELSSGKWRAVCTAVDTAWLQNLYWEHNGTDEENRLFSANVRGFVGVKGKKGAINNAIRKTVLEQPGNLFVLNNGVTALTGGVKVGAPGPDGRRVITLQGLSIVNGAQTTGAVSADTLRRQTEAGQLLIRFVVCDDPSLVSEVIRTTNRQLATQPADFRSNDRTQLRLIKEFQQLGGIAYDGGRRTDPSDIAVAPPANRVVATTAAKALAAFHGDPYIAYNEPGRIWSDDGLYANLFGDHTTARHVLFCYGLQRAVEQAKTEYAARCRNDPDLKNNPRKVHDFLQRRGAVPVVVDAVAACMDTLLGRGTRDPFMLGFSRQPTLAKVIQHWHQVLKPIVPFLPHLAPALQRGGAKGVGEHDRAKAVEDARTNFAGMVESLSDQDHTKTAFDIFRQNLGEGAR
ncbi:AIPR family protein [Streptomyces sp. NPDC093224]|uniref:AIPR family protein n=1 Tax=Streptomyces sp. NPDC093224 TaxID=3155198 RepID=UPI003424666B